MSALLLGLVTGFVACGAVLGMTIAQQARKTIRDVYEL